MSAPDLPHAELDALLSEASALDTLPARLAALASHAVGVVVVRVAQNPATPEAILDRLAVHEDPAARAAVLRNPSAPFSALALLGARDPGGFWENPAVPLLLLEDPGLLLRGASGLSLALASYEGTPPHVLHGFATSAKEDLRRAVALNPKLPDELFPLLLRTGTLRTHSALAQNPATPPEVLSLLHQKARTYDGIWRVLARNPATPALLLLGFAESEDPELRQAAAENPSLPAEARRLLERLGSGPSLVGFGTPDPALGVVALEDAAHRGGWARILAAAHPGAPDGLRRAVLRDASRARYLLPLVPWLPAWFLAELANSSDPQLRANLAQNPALPPELAAALSQDESPTVRARAAAHPALPQAERERLAQDPHPPVQAALALRTDLPPVLALRLGTSPFSRVRRAVAGRPDIPRELLARLLFDGNFQVRTAAGRSPGAKAVQDAERSRSLNIRALAEEDIQAALATGTYGKRILATHAKTPAWLLLQLAAEDASIALWLRDHPLLPPEVLDRLAGHPDTELRRWTASHTKTPPTALARLAYDSSVAVRRAVAANLYTPPDALAWLAESSDVLSREAAAKNTNTPPDALSRLRRAGSLPDLSGPNPPDPTLPEPALRALLSGGPWARRLAWSHPSATPEILARALSLDANEGDLWVRLSERPDTDPDILTRCAECLIARVRWRAAYNPGTPPATLDRLHRAGANFDLQKIVPPPAPLSLDDRAALLSGGPWARLVLARAPWLSPEERAALSADPSEVVRGALSSP